MTKKKVKKIAETVANQEITERAPGLRVATAVSAGDSDRLDGLDSKELSPGAVTETGTNVDLTTTAQPMVSTTLTTPAATVIATGTVELDADGGGNDKAACAIRIDGVDGRSYSMDIADPPNDENTVTVAGGAAVGAGAHTIELVCEQTGGAGNDIHSDEAVVVASAHL